MDKVECKEVIVSTLRRRGAGVAGDPVRIVTEVFEKNGTLIAEHDQHTFHAGDLVAFAQWCIKKNFQVQNVAIADIQKWRNDNDQF